MSVRTMSARMTVSQIMERRLPFDKVTLDISSKQHIMWLVLSRLPMDTVYAIENANGDVTLRDCGLISTIAQYINGDFPAFTRVDSTESVYYDDISLLQQCNLDEYVVQMLIIQAPTPHSIATEILSKVQKVRNVTSTILNEE